MRNAHKPQATERTPEAAASEPASMLFMAGIAKGGTDTLQRQAAYTAMRDALRFGFRLEPIFRQQAALSLAMGDHSRVAGALEMLFTLMDKAETAGYVWTAPDTVSPFLRAAMTLPGGLRSTAFAFVTKSLEDESISYLCTHVEALHQTKPFSFDDGRPECTGMVRPHHGTVKGGGRKSIPSAQRGRVIQN